MNGDDWNVEGLLGVETAADGAKGFGAAVAGFPKLKVPVVVVGVGAADPKAKPEEAGRGASEPVDFEGPKEKEEPTTGAGAALPVNENGLFSSAGFAGEKGFAGADAPKLPNGEEGVATAGGGADAPKRVDPGAFELPNAKLRVGLLAPFEVISRVGLSSIMNSWSLFLGGVDGRSEGLAGAEAPNVNGLR